MTQTVISPPLSASARGAPLPASFDLLSYPFPEPPAPGKALQVAPGVYWLKMPMPFELDHINLWLLEEADGWTIVDTGYANDATREHWEQVLRDVIGTAPVKRIIVTHFHPDHVGLAAWLMERFDAPLFMSQGEYLSAHAAHNDVSVYRPQYLINLFRRHGLEGEKLEAVAAARAYAYSALVPALPMAFIRLMEGDVLEINGRSWRVIMGYGHSPEHAALYCEELRTLISGDMVLPRISTNVSVMAFEPDGNPLRLFLESLVRYGTLPGDTLVLPSHGRVFHGLHPRVRDLHMHHEQRLGEMTAACGEPKTAEQLVEVVFRWKLDIRQTSFALGEIIAHLNFLMYRGALERNCGEDGVCRFVRNRSHLAVDCSDVM